MKIRWLFVGVITSLNFGCALLEKMKQESIKMNCNISAAYAKGINDGIHQNILPEQNYAKTNMCPIDQQSILNRKYLYGFSQGLRKRAHPIDINHKKINTNNNNEINHKTYKTSTRRTIGLLGINQLPY